jgi:hypothetical protein
MDRLRSVIRDVRQRGIISSDWSGRDQPWSFGD